MNSAERQELSIMMARLAEGDREAFAAVFARLWPELRRFAGLSLRESAEADDVAQRALLSIMARAHDYDRERDALAWAIGIATWECRSARRRAYRRRETAAVPELASPMSSPEEAYLEADLRHAVSEVLAGLTASEQAALLEGGDGSLAPATRRKRRQRALVRLREAWAKIHGER
jgi:RNA polymerase sigma factor (sigma-70 family)